ncbi:MAG: hypothetical protein HY899_12140 [Deltaproteobacteria bacterium]|nr:hypothetical protein [Deltaproteobacteria bacterium]
MIIIRLEPLRVRPGMTAADLIGQARWRQRVLWVAYVLSVATFCGVVWQVQKLSGGTGVEMVSSAATKIYGTTAVVALAAVLLRHLSYSQADALRPALQRLSIGATPSVPSFDGPSRQSGEQDLSALHLLATALNGLGSRERVVWTLCAGPVVLVLPSALLSAGTAPLAPLAAVSLVLFAVTFPQTERFVRAAGALPRHATAGWDEANESRRSG